MVDLKNLLKILTILLFLIGFLPSSIAIAENNDVVEKIGAQEDAKIVKDKSYDCLDRRNQIIKRLSKVPTCSKDTDCRYFDYGYPWQMGVCLKPIVSTTEEGRNITNLALIEEYNEKCVFNNESRKKEYNNFKKELTEKKCGRLARTFCFKGMCRTSGYILHDQPDAVIRETGSDVDMKEYLKNLK